MRASSFDFIGNLDTLLAVILGAVLATGGALVAEIIQDRLARNRREREAARFFGEVITSIDAILDLAISSRNIGHPWGRVTQRFFETALREAAVYERNRERLFEIRDPALRFEINGHVLRETVPISALLEQTQSISEGELQLAYETLAPHLRKSLENECAQHMADREESLEALLYQRAKSPEIVARLEKLARVDFKTSYLRTPDEDAAAATPKTETEKPMA